MSGRMITSDFLVIGGGVIGINIARCLKRQYADSSVALIEKEEHCGLHASGRNSGVLHAGFYYTPDSLKAKFTRLGNERLTQYCESKKIALNKCGKLVVTKDQTELASLDELLKRGRANKIELHPITAQEARTIEPRVKTFERALFSPSTSTVDPVTVMAHMREDACSEGVQIHTGSPYLGREGTTVRASKHVFSPGYVVNAAGLYADKIARDFGFSERYRILPFKGLYLYSDEPAGSIRTNIYPVPNLRNPFLGVHFTVTASGNVKIGPTAIPAFWRENYGGMSNFLAGEFLEIIRRSAGLLAYSNFDFKHLAIEEIRKYSKARMVELAGHLAEGVRVEHFSKWGRPGIRAQLLDIQKKKLEMDFVLEGDDKSMHVLNAVSPAFTCSLPFSEYVCEKITAALSKRSQAVG
jgi:(S)-2-hydroxyglutarate dehydrogenase